MTTKLKIKWMGQINITFDIRVNAPLNKDCTRVHSKSVQVLFKGVPTKMIIIIYFIII